MILNFVLPLAISVDPDGMQLSVVLHLGLHCQPKQQISSIKMVMGMKVDFFYVFIMMVRPS